MGLYDGLGGTQKEAPPIIWHRPWICRLCLCWMPVGWGARWLHFWQGYYSMTGDHRIIGVILNRTSEGVCRTMTPVIEEELGRSGAGMLSGTESLHSGEPAVWV